MQGSAAARVEMMPRHRDTPPLSSVGRQDGQRTGWSHGSSWGSRARGHPPESSCLCCTAFPNPEPLGVAGSSQAAEGGEGVQSWCSLMATRTPPPDPRCALDSDFICWSEKSNGKHPPLANIPRGSKAANLPAGL